ncbi:MAG: serine--tRNA ligase [Candidatus Puniceispirillales bacterium]|nr:serine--tRNA ligase [Pseudomonadota bacterium]
MHDIRFIRNHPDEFDKAMSRRGIQPVSAEILAIDQKRRSIQTEMQEKQQRRNEASKEVGKIKSSGGDASALIDEVAFLKSTLSDMEDQDRELATTLDQMLMDYPNILNADVPDGNDEDDNMLIRTNGDAVLPDFPAQDHVAIGEGLGMMDFALGAKLSGSRFVVLKGDLSRLERAIAAFMLDTHTREFGYTEYQPPYLVKSETMAGTGQLPKFALDLFRTTDDRWLIPTAEVPLTNLVAGEILDQSSLPLRMTAYTPCFRAEAGAAGRDTRGMIRQHQFSKVELVSISHPDHSDEELERMTHCAETVLQRLDLSYRVMKLCSGDTGFSARTTYDIEVWLPGQNEGKGMYREISSCSNCGDFQARRMRARFKNDQSKSNELVHTLNGSGLAVGRTMIAILENGQCEDGSVILPSALHPYMGGQTKLERLI